MSEIELLPCPFCGGVAVVKSITDIHKPNLDDWWVSCTVCTVERPSTKKAEIVHSRDEAIAAWNRRAPVLPEEVRADIWHLIATVSIVHHRKAIEYADRDAIIAAGRVERWLKQQRPLMQGEATP